MRKYGLFLTALFIFQSCTNGNTKINYLSGSYSSSPITVQPDSTYHVFPNREHIVEPDVEIKNFGSRVLSSAPVTPPVAQIIPHPTTYHGVTLEDNYFWLRHRPDTEGPVFPTPIMDYINAENAYTDASFAKIDQTKEMLLKEMESRLPKEMPPVAPPTGNDPFSLIKKLVEGQRHNQFYVRDNKTGQEKLVLDVNVEANGSADYNVREVVLSRDGQWMGFNSDPNGDYKFDVKVRSTVTGETLVSATGSGRVSGYSGMLFSTDSKLLYYIVNNTANRPYQVYQYDISKRTAQLLYEEKNDLFFVYIKESADRSAMIIESKGWDRSETRLLSLTTANAAPLLVAPSSKGHIYEVAVANGTAYIKTSDQATNFKIVTAPISNPAQSNWKDLVKGRSHRTIEAYRVFKNHLVRIDREGSKMILRILNLTTQQEKVVNFSEPSYLLDFEENIWDSSHVRIRYESFLTPRQFISIDMNNGKKTILSQAVADKQKLDLSKYEQKLIMAASEKDGYPIPIWLVYKKGTKFNKAHPLFIWSYSNYGSTWPSSYWGAFKAEVFSLIDRGVVYAETYGRGSGMLGRQGYLDGKFLKKRNTFEDFVSAHNYLIKNHYTSAEKTVVQSASAGGLLIGYLVNNRPKSAKAFIANVPFVDLINTESDETIPLTVQEWDEWGSPYVRDQFHYMRTYSPYDNVRPQAYPPILATTSLRDMSVYYWEPLKWVANMRAKNTGKDQIYIRLYHDGNHTDGVDRVSILKRPALNYAYALDQLGIQ